MLNNQPELTNLLFGLEILTSFTAIFYFVTLKKTYWRWFVVYLFVISILDVLIVNIIPFLGIKKQYFHPYLVIPLQFIFFYSLYAFQ